MPVPRWRDRHSKALSKHINHLRVENIMAGKVYLVGAGPGDPGLLTLKGKAALERADCVIYDILANDRLLNFARPECERIFVKTLGPRPTVRQNEVNRLMIARAREG